MRRRDIPQPGAGIGQADLQGCIFMDQKVPREVCEGWSINQVSGVRRQRRGGWDIEWERLGAP
jgi:hypothetical protein